MNRPIQTLALVLTAVALATLVAPRVFAATPPTQIHYQGVLRDASDNPRNGNFDMIFRFFDLSVGGNEILVDQHEAAGSGAVTVTGGLFGAELGGGIVSDGASAETYTSLSQVFRDFTSVFLQIQVAGETLVPRVRVLASAYALNADQLDGKDSTGFIDTSAASQAKAGDLTVADLNVSGNDINLSTETIQGTDCCVIHGTFACDDPDITACVCAADPYCCSTQWDSICAAEVVSVGCGTCSGASIQRKTARGPGSNAVSIFAGTQGPEDLFLVAGNTWDDGRLAIKGEGAFEMRAGNGLFQFVDGATGLETASLNSAGDLQIDGDLTVSGGDIIGLGNVGFGGDLTVSGNDIAFGSAGAAVHVTGSGFQLTAGDTDTDDLALVAGNSLDDGQLLIFGDGAVEMRAGSGLFQFFNGATALETASLSSAGALQIDGDLTVSGDDITFGSAGAAVHVTGSGFQLTAGDTDTDDLALVAGNSLDDGQLLINGDGAFEMRAGNGLFSFVNGATALETASLDATGALQIDGNLTVSGGLIDQGGAGSLVIRAPVNVLVEADGSVRAMIDKDNNAGTQLAVWFHDGVYSNANEIMELSEGGILRTRGIMTPSVAFDLAETFFMAEPLEPGDVVRVVAGRPNAVQKTGLEGDRAVLGVVSTRPGVLLGGAPFDTPSLGEAWGPAIASLFEEKRADLEARVKQENPALAQDAEGAARVEGLALEKFQEEYFAPIALAGRVPVKVDASFGAIEIGDALAPSSIPGVAMKATRPGPIVGTALEPLAHGRGTVVAFVHRGWYGGGASDAPAPGVDVAAAHKAEQAAGSVAPGDSVVYGSAPDAALEARAELAPVPAVEAVPFAFPVKIVQEVESGDVLAADASRPGEFLLAGEMGDPLVIGIAAGEAKAIWSGRAPLALPGTLVQCKVDAAYGVIRPGDLLVASPTPGHAMLSTEAKPGTVIAKALESLDFGTGTILVLVQPR